MSWDFHVGQKVVCVDPDWHDPHPNGWPCPLVMGATYTITSLSEASGPYRGSKDHFCLHLAEVRNPHGGSNDDVGFADARFRPLVTKQTDISIFTAMLSPKKVSEPA